MGDDIQAIKAGIMEIGDVFVINKADREGAERAAFAIHSSLELRVQRTEWSPPVLLTTASQGTGIAEVADAFEEHLSFLRERGGLDGRRRERLEQRLGELVRERLWRRLRARVNDTLWSDAVGALVARRLTPHQAAEWLEETLAATDDAAPRGEPAPKRH